MRTERYGSSAGRPEGSGEGIVLVVWRNTCPLCGTTRDVAVELPEWTEGVVTGGDTSDVCEACRIRLELEKAERLRRKESAERIARAKIPLRFQTWDRSLGNAELARTVFENRGKSMILTGPNGCCKTRAAAYNLLLEAKRGTACRFIRFSELAAEYACVCKTACEESQAYILRLMHENEILMIDDLGKRRITETAGEMLYEMFDRLYAGDEEVRMWCTSNIRLAELAERFENPDIGDAVASRIDRMIDSGDMTLIEI